MKKLLRQIKLTLTIARHISLMAAVLLFTLTADAQTTSFTFQNTLPNEITPATGKFEMEVRLFDAAAGGTQIGATNLISEVEVKTRAFTVWLDFGAAAFPGADRFVEVSFRRSGSNEPFTTLAPRTQILSVPYAIRALNATTADNALNLNGVDVNNLVQTNDSRLSDNRNPNPGSNNYIQNTTTTQAGANFNIDGSGTAGGTLSGSIVNAATRYDIGGSRVLSVAGTDNLFAGIDAGTANTTGFANLFVGANAGAGNTTGRNNSFVGAFAGFNNTTGVSNSFFGRSAGFSNTTGSSNSFFGIVAGVNNTTGDRNSFFGESSGFNNTTGNNNSFFGNDAGFSNTTGFDNSFFGRSTGLSNTTGNSNAFFGRGAGSNNTTGFGNSFVGVFAGSSNTTGNNNSFVGGSAGRDNTTGVLNSFFGLSAGFSNTTGSNNSFFGRSTGVNNTTGSNNTLIGGGADVGIDGLLFATAIGASAVVRTNNTIVLGRENGSDTVRIFGLGAAGSTQLCRNADNEISTCSSSLRYKTNIAPFGFGLSVVNRLQPITFKWRNGEMLDLGFGAEDVAAIEPLLVTYNKDGQVEGVKYDRIGVVLINAVKEQQRQIEAQQKQIVEQKEIIRRQQAEFESLKKYICSQTMAAEFCRPQN